MNLEAAWILTCSQCWELCLQILSKGREMVSGGLLLGARMPAHSNTQTSLPQHLLTFPSQEWMPTSCHWWRAREVSLSAAGQPEIVEWKVTVLGVFVHVEKGGLRIRWKSSPEARQRVTEGAHSSTTFYVSQLWKTLPHQHRGRDKLSFTVRSGAHLKAIVKGDLIRTRRTGKLWKQPKCLSTDEWIKKEVEYIFEGF